MDPEDRGRSVSPAAVGPASDSAGAPEDAPPVAACEASGDAAGPAARREAKRAVGLGRSRPLVAFMARGFLAVGSRVPLWAMQLLGLGVGNLAGLLPTRSRSRCLANLRTCLPELSPREHRRIARRSLASMACGVCELPLFWNLPNPELLALCREVEGLDVLERGLAAGRGVLLMVPHLGAWELGGLYCSTRFPTTGLFRPSRVREMDAELCAGRGRFGAQLVPAGVGAVRSVRRALQRGEIAVVLPDTDPKRGNAVFAPFFGEPANTGTLLPRLARDSGAAVVLCVAERLGLGRGFRLRFQAVGDELADPDAEAAAAAMNRAVERAIRQLPDQYLWRYRRFRRRPPGRPCLYGEDETHTKEARR